MNTFSYDSYVDVIVLIACSYSEVFSMIHDFMHYFLNIYSKCLQTTFKNNMYQHWHIIEEESSQ